MSAQGWEAGSRFSTVTPDDHQAWLWVLSILSLIYSFFMLGARIMVKWKDPGYDDLALGIAYVSLCKWGLGRKRAYAQNNRS